MHDFYFTFGTQYAHEPHPALQPAYCNPNGYVRVRAHDEIDARTWFARNLTHAWAGTYTEADHPGQLTYGRSSEPVFPAGELLAFTTELPAVAQHPGALHTVIHP